MLPDSIVICLSQALYHALPMQYVTVAKLHNKLGGEANQTTVRKFIDKMTREGFVEAKGNRRLGVCSSCCQLKSFVLSVYLCIIKLCPAYYCHLFSKPGKRVIHSDTTQKKLTEVKKALNIDAMVYL